MRDLHRFNRSCTRVYSKETEVVIIGYNKKNKEIYIYILYIIIVYIYIMYIHLYF